MDKLTKLLRLKGASLVGYADLSILPSEVRHNFPSGVSIGVALDKKIVSNIATGPTKEYEHEYRKVNSLLNELTSFAAAYYKKQGLDAVTKAPSGMKFSDDFVTLLPHKTVATLAGLGWIGKCALLITKRFGSAIRFATVLTTAIPAYGDPIIESECDECMKCVDICPGNAPSGINWSQDMRREEIYDVSACYQVIQDWMKANDIQQYICGMCIHICPWTQKYIQRTY